MGVADVTDESSRSLGYGLVTAGFAASLIISPALGAGIELLTGSDEAVVILASLVALLDVFFIVIFVPESLMGEQKMAIKSLTFQQMNPFASLRGIWSDRRVLLMSMVAVLSYLPEAGQSTCFFVYLTLVLGFSPMMVGVFICYVGVLSTIFQTGQEEGATKRDVVEATSSSSQSENSETKMEVNGNNSSSSSFADLKDGKLEVTRLSEEDTGKIHINGQTMKASYAA